jgi:hypothetical protein
LFLAQNLNSFASQVFRQMPIGIENIRLGRTGLKKYHKFEGGHYKEDKVLIPPMSPTNQIRSTVLQQASSLGDCFHIAPKLVSEKAYFKLVRSYKFILCCEGNGYDTHRLWETFYQGSFPVVFNSSWADSLRVFKLPVLFIDDLSELSQSKLDAFAELHADFNPINNEVLWIPFWRHLVNSYTEAV